MIKIAADNLSLKFIQNFCLENGQICETALCWANCIDLTQIRAGYRELSAVLFAIFKVIFLQII